MSQHAVFALQLVITGIAVGGVYALIALGFVLIYKASAVVNFGPGELVLFGAYIAWATILHMHFPLYVAFPVTLAVAPGGGRAWVADAILARDQQDHRSPRRDDPPHRRHRIAILPPRSLRSRPVDSVDPRTG